METSNLTPNVDANTQWEYIGWIPCLSGELLFKHTVPALAEYDISFINFLGYPDKEKEQTRRYVAATSVYDWKDSGDPRETGVVRVVVVAQQQGVSPSKNRWIVPLRTEISLAVYLWGMARRSSGPHQLRKGR